MPTTIINNYAITVDALKLMVTADTAESPADVNLLTLTYTAAADRYQASGFTLEKEVSNNPAYHLQFGILHHSQRLGTIYTDLTKKYGYNQHIRPLHIDNAAFYTLNFAKLVPEFLTAFGLVIHNESQIDIALDTQQIDPSKLILNYTQNTTEFQRIKRHGDRGLHIDGSLDETTGSMAYTTYINRGSATVEATIYDKTKELHDKKHKPYITQWHGAHGFDPALPVYRLELTIKAKALSTYTHYAVTADGEVTTVYRANNNDTEKATKYSQKTRTNIELDKLQNPAYLVTLFKHFFNVDIRRKDRTRSTNCTRVEMIDYTIYGEEQVNHTVTEKPTTNKLTMEKKRIKQDLEDFKTTGNELYLAVAVNIAQRHQLMDTLNQLIQKLGINDAVQAHGLQQKLEDFSITNKLHIAA